MMSIVSTFAGDGLVKIWARSQLAVIVEGFESSLVVLGAQDSHIYLWNTAQDDRMSHVACRPTLLQRRR